MIRLLIVDDHQLVRAGLRTLLAHADDLEIVGEAGCVADAVREAALLAPDVVLMDLRLPDGTGIDACREILSNAAHTRVLFLTSYADEQAVISTVLAGAVGYLMKDIEYHALVSAIRDAAAGRPIVDPRVTEPVVGKLQRAEALTAQERRVLELVVQGKTNKQIAITLGLSDKTVKNYLSNAFQKLEISRRGEAAAALGTTGRIAPG